MWGYILPVDRKGELLVGLSGSSKYMYNTWEHSEGSFIGNSYVLSQKYWSFIRSILYSQLIPKGTSLPLCAIIDNRRESHKFDYLNFAYAQLTP